MNVTCQHCKTTLNIPDHKLPKDKEASFKCPKCKGTVQVSSAKQKESFEDKKGSPFQFSFEDRLSVLVCTDNKDLKNLISSTVKQMGFNAEIADHTKAALNKMEYHSYHLVILDDAFDQENKGLSGIIDKLNAIDMSIRRRICLVLVSHKFNTNDNMAALHSSVNSIIHQDDILHLETFLSRVLAEHKNLYTIYNESLKLLGKA